MNNLVSQIEDHLKQTDRFLWCFDRATSHVYGLVKAAFSEVKDRVGQHYRVVRELWDDQTSRKEVLKSVENSLQSISSTKGNIIHTLASMNLPGIASVYFGTFSKMINLIDNFKELLRIRVVGGPLQDNVELYRKVDEILMSFG